VKEEKSEVSKFEKEFIDVDEDDDIDAPKAEKKPNNEEKV